MGPDVSSLPPVASPSPPRVVLAQSPAPGVAVTLARSPAYINEPDVTAQPRDERTAREFEDRGRMPRLDEIEHAEWSRDRWRE